MADAAALTYRDVRFAYPVPEGVAAGGPALRGASCSVPEGAFCLLTGPTGSGKSTLLRLAKPEIAPEGELSGSITVFGHEIDELAGNPELSASCVGYVSQDPDAQIVCDSVWHEMAFGLEGLGASQDEMRRRVAETSYFFGIDRWFRRRCADLSGGQRQVLALASTLVMRPRLLLLDEPTSMLDPVAARNFVSLLYRVNRELGVTVVVATHSPALFLDYATMALRLGEGEGRGTVEACLLENLRHEKAPDGMPMPARHANASAPIAISASSLWFRYGRDDDWVLRDCALDIAQGEARALVGANGCGKSTLLSLIAGTWRPLRGRIHVDSKLHGSQALLPQSPKALLSRESVDEELMEWSAAGGYGRDDARGFFQELLGGLVQDGQTGMALFERHPYDLSGGQQEILALAKLLLLHPRLLLLDEPTQGLDARARSALSQAVLRAREQGTTVVVATHDLAFCHGVCDTVSMMFDGGVTVTEPVGDFIEGSWIWRA